MKVEIDPQRVVHRGGEVEVGNVYTNPHGKYVFKLVVGIVDRARRGGRPWNNIVLLHLDAQGDVVGASTSPLLYVSEHHDLVGRVAQFPKLKLTWLHK